MGAGGAAGMGVGGRLVMAVTFLEVDYVSVCQLVHIVGQELQAEHSFPCERTQSRVKFLEKVL